MWIARFEYIACSMLKECDGGYSHRWATTSVHLASTGTTHVFMLLVFFAVACTTCSPNTFT